MDNAIYCLQDMFEEWNAIVTSETNKPLKPELVKIIFKNSVRTAKKALHFTIAKINWLTLF
jgi:hypothetical protein